MSGIQFSLPRMALCTHRYTLAQGSGWKFLPEHQLATSYFHFGKSVFEDPVGKAFLRYLPCAVATRGRLGNFPEEHAKTSLYEDCTGVRMR